MTNYHNSWRNFINEATYVAQPGDNLTKIAKANNLTLQQLLDANPKYKENPDLVIVNQNINIPDGGDEDPLPLDEETVILELEVEIQELFSSYYKNMNNFKNNLRDCVSLLTLLEEDNFDSEERKKTREDQLVETWYHFCLVPFFRDQVYTELGKGGFQVAIEKLGYEESKFKQTLKDISAATLKYVTNFTIPQQRVFDSRRCLDEIVNELQEIKTSVAKQASDYLQQQVSNEKFKAGTTMADVWARFNQVSIRSR